MRIQSLTLKSFLFVAASFAAFAPAAHAGNSMLRLHATTDTPKDVPFLPSKGMDLALDVVMASGSSDIAGICIGMGSQAPATKEACPPNRDFHSLAEINKGFVLIPMFPKFMTLKGNNLSASSGGSVTLTYENSSGGLTPEEIGLVKSAASDWATARGNHLEIKVGKFGKSDLIINSMQFSTQ